MRAVVITEPGAEPVCTDFPEPEVVPGTEELTLVAAGVSWVARSLSAGTHYAARGGFPRVPGVDAVARTADGRLVFTGWVAEPWGTMAERMAAPAAFELPAGADPLTVAAGMNPGLSGRVALELRRDEIRAAGDAGPDAGADAGLGTVLVLGATGLSGFMAVQSALELGATRVVAAGRRPAALEALAALGAEPVDVGHDPVGRLRAALADASPSVVLDFVWGPVAEAAFEVLTGGGQDDDGDIAYTQIGSLAGATAALPSALLRSRRIRVVGHGLGSVPRARLVASVPEVLARLADGRLSAPATAYPMSRAAEAWRHAGPSRAVVVPD